MVAKKVILEFTVDDEEFVSLRELLSDVANVAEGILNDANVTMPHGMEKITIKEV